MVAIIRIAFYQTPQDRNDAFATNREESASAVIHLHNQRGESENWHKELKLGYGMEQMPCGELAANALFFAIGVLAYNLGVLLKAELLPAEYRHAPCKLCVGNSTAWPASWCGMGGNGS